MDYDPVQQAANLFTGESATAQRLTTEGDMFQDLQAVANVLTNVVVGASVELTFAPGETEKYLEIVPKDNRTGDGDRMFYVILGAPSGTTTNSSASTCAFTIVDDEEQEPAVVSFSDAVYSAAGDSVTVTVNRSGAMNTVVSAAVKTTGEGTAQAGRDYSEVDTELVFPFGVDHLSVEIPVRTEYLSGEGDFALTLEPVAGCTVGENASATAVLFGSYTGKASLTAQGTRALSSPSAGSITNDDAIIKNNLSTYKTLDEIDLSQPYYHGTAIGSDFEGKDYYVDSGKYYETMWKGDGRGVVGVIYALCDDEDPLVSYYLAGAEVTWDRSYGCGDPAWIKVGIAGNDIFSLETDAKTPNDDSYDYWFPYDSTRSFDTETRYIYPHKNAVDYSAWSRKGFGGSYPRYIEILNYANCEDCSWLHIKSIKPILRPILVTVEPITPLSYIQEDGTVAEDTKAVNAEIVDGGTSAVYFMDDSITVRASTEVGVLQYGYLAGLQLVDSDGDPITTIASNEDPTVNSITYTFNTENMGKLVSQRWSVTDVVTQLLIRSNADYANPYQENRDGLPTFLSYKLKPQYSYADAMVNLHNPYEFPVTMTISGRDYTLAAGQTLVLRHDDRPIHKGDTLAVSRITLGGANSELYTPVGVRYSGKFQLKNLLLTSALLLFGLAVGY